jgi:hypothetical protein
MFMKKVFLFFALAIVSFSAVQAQSKTSGLHFGGGLRVGVPVSDLADGYSVSIGAELQGEYMFSENVSATLSSGYNSFLGKKIEGVKVDAMGYIPVLAGVRFYPSPSLFLGARAGVGILTGDGESTSGFNYEPQVGFNSEKIQVAVGYNGLTKKFSGVSVTNSHLSLTAIYKFN